MMALLTLVWTPFLHLRRLKKGARSDNQTELPVFPVEQPEKPRAVTSQVGLTEDEDAIEGYWSTIIVFLEEIRRTTGIVFAEYRKEAGDGRMRPGYDGRILEARARRLAATAGDLMNEVLDIWMGIKREISSFER